MTRRTPSRGETAPAQAAAARHHGGGRVQVAGDLADRGAMPDMWRRMNGSRVTSSAISPPRSPGGSGSWLPVIQIQRVSPVRRADGVGIGLRDPRARTAVVKAVAQGDHGFRPVAGNQLLKLKQGRAGVVGRQVHAARGKGRTLLEMQIGNHQRRVFGQEQRRLRCRATSAAAKCQAVLPVGR